MAGIDEEEQHTLEFLQIANNEGKQMKFIPLSFVLLVMFTFCPCRVNAQPNYLSILEFSKKLSHEQTDLLGISQQLINHPDLQRLNPVIDMLLLCQARLSHLIDLLEILHIVSKDSEKKLILLKIHTHTQLTISTIEATISFITLEAPYIHTISVILTYNQLKVELRNLIEILK